jgi:hypothetical protein
MRELDISLQVQILTVDQVWKGGKLVDRNEYREQIIDEEDDDEVEDEVSVSLLPAFALVFHTSSLSCLS